VLIVGHDEVRQPRPAASGGTHQFCGRMENINKQEENQKQVTNSYDARKGSVNGCVIYGEQRSAGLDRPAAKEG